MLYNYEIQFEIIAFIYIIIYNYIIYTFYIKYLFYSSFADSPRLPLEIIEVSLSTIETHLLLIFANGYINNFGGERKFDSRLGDKNAH